MKKYSHLSFLFVSGLFLSLAIPPLLQSFSSQNCNNPPTKCYTNLFGIEVASYEYDIANGTSWDFFDSIRNALIVFVIVIFIILLIQNLYKDIFRK